MTSTFTTNKNLEKPGNGDYVDTWNVPVNADLDVIDQALGTVTSINLASSNVTLADTQYRSMGLVFTGALSANRSVTVPSGVGGMWVVRNNTTDATGGPWTVTIQSAGGGTSVILVRSKSSIVYSDGTNITAVEINASVGSGSVTSVAVSGGTTGLTTSGGPITTSGTITLSGTLIPTNGGTGISTYTVGDILYASASNTLTTLSSVATGNAIISGGVGGAPAWGKIGLTTHVSGTLPVANGGTGVTSSTGTGSVVLNTNPSLNGFTGTTAIIDIGLGQFYKDISGNLGLGGVPGSFGSTNRLEVITPNGTPTRILLAQSGITNYSFVIPSSTNAFCLYNGSSTELIRFNQNGAIGFGGANYGTSGQIPTSGGSSATPTWTTVTAGTGISVSAGAGSLTIANTGVTSVTAGNGLSGGTITTTGTIALDFYSGSTATNTSFPIGSYLLANNLSGGITNNSSQVIYVSSGGSPTSYYTYNPGGGVSTVSGTWRARGSLDGQNITLFQRVA